MAFEELDVFDWNEALIIPDERFNYRELRFLAYGLLRERLHVIVFTSRGDALRIIGARKANDREKRMYDEKSTSP